MGSSSPPRSEPIPPIPKKKDPAVQEADAEAIRRRQTARGFRSTILAKSMMDNNSPALKDYFGS